MTDNLLLNQDIKKHLTDILINEGLSSNDIQIIINDSYQNFSSEDDIKSKLPYIFNNNEYLTIIDYLSEGYDIDEISQEIGIRKDKIDSFKTILSKNNLTVESVIALNKYTTGSNMILGLKRGVSKETILENINNEFINRMIEYLLNDNQIKEIKEYISNLDYSIPLHKNYQNIREYLNQYNISNKFVAAILSYAKNLNSYYHLDKTILNLDKCLQTRLPESMIVYRSVKKSFLEEQVKDSSIIGLKIEDSGYSSTSPLYDTSFAKYDDYEVVFKIYVPKGTQGIQVTPFSSYGDAEEEILLNANDLYILDKENIIDKNGKKKIICKSLLLSKDKSCYKGIGNIDYNELRNKIINIIDSNISSYVHLDCSLFKDDTNEEKCRILLEIIDENDNKKVLFEQDFAYDEQFKRNMLEHIIMDFARRTPFNSTSLSPTPNQSLEQISLQSRSNVRLYGENNNILTVSNVPTAVAVKIQERVPDINPDIYIKQLEQERKNGIHY